MEKEQDVTRREFLKTAATVAPPPSLTGLGAPHIIIAQSAGNPVRYGFIGTGTEGCTLLKFLATIPEGRCIATCDIYPPNLKKGVETIGSNPETYAEYRKMLERKDMDAVMIATPLNLHAQMVVDALNAGKHVFVEKTMYFKEEEGELIRKAMEDHPKLVLQVGLQRRSSVLYQVAMEMIRKGALGKIMFVRAQWHRNSNWRRPVPDPKFERLINWRMYKEYSGGMLAELASHQIDVANWAFGAEPLSVIATGGIDYWKDGREVCDNVEGHLRISGRAEVGLERPSFATATCRLQRADHGRPGNPDHHPRQGHVLPRTGGQGFHRQRQGKLVGRRHGQQSGRAGRHSHFP